MSSPYPRNAWYVGAWSSELVGGALLSRKILGDHILFYRTASGAPAALIDRCCHRKAPLSAGAREGDNIRCMYHGLVFAPDGRCVEIPGQDHVSAAVKVRSFPVLERDNYVWIWPGDPALADPNTIVPRPWQSSRDWAWLPGYVHYDADYRLIMDNLLDFSHLSFVHAATLGGSRSMATTAPKIERIDGGIRFTRWYPEDPLPPYLKDIAQFDGPVDRWQIYEWRTAGNLLDMDSGSAPAGTGALQGHLVPQAMQFHSVQSLTPETETTCHYFWSYPHNFDTGNTALTQLLADNVYLGFMEDKAMIEAQQRVILEYGEDGMLPLGMDAGVVQGRRMLNKMIEAERGGIGQLK